ncbi:MAG: response regulator [Calditrichaeota bacterium]|nr:response regulator [Calditrichota bacterium]
MEKQKVLIVNARGGVMEELSAQLEKEGYQIIKTSDPEEVKDMAAEEKPAAVLVNVDGFTNRIWDVCRNLKDDFETRKSALLMISEEGDENEVIRAIQLGADDYVVSPFNNKTMIARMKAVIERLRRIGSKKIRVKDIEIDLDEHKVRKSGKPIDLTYIQFKLLYLLASRRENVFSRKEILEKVWGRKVYVTNRTVDVHIKRLREKLGEYKYPSQYIETIHGTGYRFL